MVFDKFVNAYRPQKEYFDPGEVKQNKNEEDEQVNLPQTLLPENNSCALHKNSPSSGDPSSWRAAQLRSSPLLPAHCKQHSSIVSS